MNIKEKIAAANQKAADTIINSDPYWIDIKPAIECIDGMEDHMILHSGPPITYNEMVELHKRGMRNAALMEGWAKTDAEADEILSSGEIKLESALDHNTVGAGTGIITKSLSMMVTEDRATGKTSANIPMEGDCEGGFAGWGRFSPEIGENLKYLRGEVFPYIGEMLRKRGGVSTKPILAEGLQMGDEHHTRQDAAGIILLQKVATDIAKMRFDSDTMEKVMHYMADTPRIFHPIGMGACRSAMLSNVGLEHSTIITAMGGNGVEFGIKVAGLGDQWFTAPAPKLKSSFTSSKYSEDDSLPWMGDSCIVECAGVGGLAAASSPIVVLLRGQKLRDGINQTKEMSKICVTKNHNFPIPNLDFDFLPLGLDIRLILKTGILPVMHGGNFHHNGGLIGAGTGCVPMECVEKAFLAFAEKYKDEV